MNDSEASINFSIRSVIRRECDRDLRHFDRVRNSQDPGKSEKDSHVIEELAEKVASEGLFLSMAAVLETGNHIGQLMDGGSRRNCAKKLVTLVQNALSGQSPFVPLGFGVGEWTFLKDGISEFPEWAAQNAGLGDLSIKKDWEKQCVLNPGRRVYIWSLDAHLSCFDRAPEIAAS